MALTWRDSAVPGVRTVDDGDPAARERDGELAGALTFRPVPDRRHSGDRRGAFRGGRRAIDCVPQMRSVTHSSLA
jgi:hypothetical protein